MAPKALLAVAEKAPSRSKNSAPIRSALSYVQIMGTGLDTEDTAPSVMLFMENPVRRFIFNAGEGLQRYCMEHKIRFTRIDNILLTRVCSETAGGLPGLLLTLMNLSTTVHVMGPSNLQKLVDAMRTFVPGAVVRAQSFGDDLQPSRLRSPRRGNTQKESGALKEAETAGEKLDSSNDLLPVYDDDTVKILAAILIPDTKDVGIGATPIDDDGRANKESEGFSNSGNGSPKNGRGRVRVQPADLAVVYVCELPTLQGKFDPQKAKDLGLMPGIRYGLLQKGSSVQSDDGKRTIHPHEVMSPPIPGPTLLLIDCPSVAHLPSLINSSSLAQFYFPELSSDDTNPSNATGKKVQLAIHLSPLSIVKRDDYRQWMSRFGNQAHHILAGHGRMGAAAPVMATSAKVSARLNLLCPRVFPALGLGLGESQWAGVASESAMVIDETQWTTMKGEVTVGREWEANLGPITMSENLLKFQLQPALNSGIDRTAVPKPLLVHEVQQSLVEERPDVFEAAQQVAALWDDCSRELQEGPVHDGAKILAENVDGDTQCQDVGVATRREYTEEPWLCEDIAYTSGSASTAAMEVEGERECTGLGASSEISRAILVEERQDAVEGPLCSAETDARGKGTYATSEIADVERNKMDAANEAETKDVVTQETHSNWTRAGEESVDLPECLKGIGRREMEMVFLGTGSSMPSKYRNVSAIYVHLFERGGIMLDCGEGTYGQLRRRYGNKGADEIIARLGMIWISHIHADHHVGMLRILAVRQLLLGGPAKCPPLLLVGPRQLKPLLNAYQQLENLSVVFLDCSQTTKHAETMAQKFQSEEAADEPAKSRENSPVKGEGGRSGLVQLKEEGGKGRKRLQPFWQQQDGSPRDGLDLDGRRKLTEVLSGLGLARLESVEVNHCQHAYGVVLESLGIARGSTSDSDIQSRSKGWKLAYSGDTRPCQALVDASRGATVLIHEATFDDGLQEDAISKRHSMTKEAVKVGVLAGAYRTILTHFSQRYPKIPVIDDSYTDRTCIAFDMMSANLADLPILPKILPALKVLFKEEHMEAEEAKAEMTSQQV